ncbi:hypothetical protein PN498_26725 [Oscillatoria sp. CS-180]|uniref:hypothetical protein n=1 Tax=Oscillatoria sp. CS-180 TaxID=3021720 RepID=UPI00232BA4BF|nr:hypothetical protein [Oscillatoria sp. CS-180]MDB9529614.1 hypothetical protein [Oscillatoria sp. CS-180]
MPTNASTATTLAPALQDYQRFWIMTESLVPRIYDSSELNEAIADFQQLLRHGHVPHFLGEKADSLLQDLSLPEPAVFSA